MRMALDARWIFPEITGIGSYTTELIGALAGESASHRTVLLFDHPGVRERIMAHPAVRTNPHFESRLVPWGPFDPLSQLRLPGLLRALEMDVYHAPNYLIPFMAFPRRGRRTACVITLHDLIPLLFPQYTPRALKTRFRFLFRRVLCASARRAEVLLVPSQSTRSDVLRHLDLPPDRSDRVVTVPEGVNARYRPGRRRPGTPPTVLYVGRSDPYKNLAVLVGAFARLRTRLPDARLRVIGPPDPRYPQARQKARELGLGGAVAWEGYADGDTLLDAYQQASVLVLASEYEGFGLPVLEAMACGTPVICGNRGSLPEVAGDAALTVTPGDQDALAAALEEVFTSPERAAGLRRLGLERAARYTWKAAASATLAAYERAFHLVREARHD